MESNGLSRLYMYQIYQKVRFSRIDTTFSTPNFNRTKFILQVRININLLNRVNIDL